VIAIVFLAVWFFLQSDFVTIIPWMGVRAIDLRDQRFMDHSHLLFVVKVICRFNVLVLKDKFIVLVFSTNRIISALVLKNKCVIITL